MPDSRRPNRPQPLPVLLTRSLTCRSNAALGTRTFPPRGCTRPTLGGHPWRRRQRQLQQGSLGRLAVDEVEKRGIFVGPNEEIQITFIVLLASRHGTKP